MQYLRAARAQLNTLLGGGRLIFYVSNGQNASVWTRRAKSVLAASILASSISPIGASATTIVSVDVAATANIWGAGHSTPPAPAGGGAGTLPVSIPIPNQNGGTVQFVSVTGEIAIAPTVPSNGADGIETSSVLLPTASLGGIAGVAIARWRFLAGVFLDDSEPMDPAPPPLEILDASFESLSPGLAQTFFIGDGLTGVGTGSAQEFQIPAGATRLYLGFFDTDARGAPGNYGDNTDSIAIDAVVVPEPSTLPLLVLGLAILARSRRLTSKGS